MAERTYPLIRIVENVRWGDQIGCAKVFDDEIAAEAMLPEYPKGSKLTCCGGYFNAVWIPYNQ